MKEFCSNTSIEYIIRMYFFYQCFIIYRIIFTQIHVKNLLYLSKMLGKSKEESYVKYPLGIVSCFRNTN